MLPRTALLLTIFALASSFSQQFAHAFVSPHVQLVHKTTTTSPAAALPSLSRSPISSLKAAADDDSSKKRRKRRRKQQPPQEDGAAPTTQSLPTSQQQSSPPPPEFLRTMDMIDESIDFEEELTEEAILEIARVANFQFKPKDNWNDVVKSIDTSVKNAPRPDNVAIPLPDIREARMKKVQDAVRKDVEPERVKIKRGDAKALRDLMELQPFADADDSYFEEEEYGTVSALLGEGTKPFLGIPPGPLQVGHFIGALVIILMAFVEYPGFPLTNLPSPLRDALQGGLGCVFAVNTALAVFASSKAEERGQSKVLWAIKTFSVGGLAIDQLTQLPTLEQAARAKARKGKRQ